MARSNEGHMDWQYQNEPPMDKSSPFAQVGPRPPTSSFKSSPSKLGAQNPFAFGLAAQAQKPPVLPAPFRYAFKPMVNNQYSSTNFPRNPSFMTPQTTTPQKNYDDSMDMSGADDSPAMTDASGFVDTPDMDRSQDYQTMSINRSPNRSPNRLLFPKSPGRGELPRTKTDYQRDKVRKRKRLPGDRDVGTGRSRLPHDSDESDSDYEGNQSGSRKGYRPGWIRTFLGTIHDHPSAPIILSWYLQFTVNLFFIGLGMWCVWSFISMMRADLALATEKARAVLLGEMEACAREFTMNKCAPLSHRVPAMEALCNEWEMCMNQDPNSVMKVQVSVKNVAEIINEFCSVISWKAMGFILITISVVLVANNVGLGKYRQSLEAHHQPSHPAPSQRADFNMLSSPQRDPNQAYIFAPIGHTPRHIRRAFLQDEQTDTDASPDYKTIMAPPPRTPSRRSSSKGERGRSPTKAKRSPSKGY